MPGRAGANKHGQVRRPDDVLGDFMVTLLCFADDTGIVPRFGKRLEEANIAVQEGEACQESVHSDKTEFICVGARGSLVILEFRKSSQQRKNSRMWKR